MSTPRIDYFDITKITDPRMLAEFQRAREQGMPRPESHAIRANVPAVFWAFANAWRDTFVNGVCDHAVKSFAGCMCRNQSIVRIAATSAPQRRSVVF
jgi:hypothetical protein